MTATPSLFDVRLIDFISYKVVDGVRVSLSIETFDGILATRHKKVLNSLSEIANDAVF